MSGSPYRALIGLDCIQLAAISGRGRHGVYPSERENPQTFVVDLDMYCDLRAARDSDDVDDTVDYSVIAQQVRDIIEGTPHNLIESLADAVAAKVLEYGPVQVVRVRVHKPEAPLTVSVSDVAVTVWAGLDSLPDGAAAGTEEPGDERPRHWMEHGASGADEADFPGLDRRPDKPRSVVLGLGANLGNREQTLRDVIGELDHWEGIGVTEVSPLVRTAAVLRPDQPSQPDYVNAVVLAQTMLSPRDLLGVIQALEDRHGRTRDEQWGPRTLDIDIISYEGVTSQDPQLTLPHPRAATRAFVLVPWRYIRADAHLAGVGPVAELADAAPDRAGVRSIHPNWLAQTGSSAGEPEPLPLPKWEAVRDDQPPRILDDPESVVLSQEPVDPRLSMRPSGGSPAIGIAGVSTTETDTEATQAAEKAPAERETAPEPAAAPSLWQRIKAHFTGAPAPAPTPAPTPQAAPVPPLPAPLSATAPVVVDDPDTAVEGVNTKSLRQLDTAALEQVDTDGDHAEAEENDPEQAAGDTAGEASDAEREPKPAHPEEPETAAPEAAGPEADDAAVGPLPEADQGGQDALGDPVATPPEGEAASSAAEQLTPRQGVEAGAAAAVLPTPPQPQPGQEPRRRDDEDETGENTQPISVGDLDDDDEVPRPEPEPPVENPQRQSLKERLQGFSPVPPPGVCDQEVTLPMGLAQKFEASRQSWAVCEDPALPTPTPAPAPPAPAPDAPAGPSARTHTAGEDDLVERRRRFRHRRRPVTTSSVPEVAPAPPVSDADAPAEPAAEDTATQSPASRPSAGEASAT